MKKAGKVLLLVALVLALAVLKGAFYVVQPNEYGVVRQFGAVQEVKEEPGLYLKIPYVQTVSTLPKTVLLYDLPISDVITADKHSMVLDSFALWRISDPRLFIESLSGSVATAESRINAIVYNALKTVISSQKQETIISGRDGRVVQLVMENIGDNFERYGIEMIAVETKTLDLPDDNKEAVYTRMISERNNIAASYAAEGAAEAKRIRNEADKQVEIILSEAKAGAEAKRAEGDAEYMRILSEIYDTREEAEFYTFMIALDAMEESMQGGDKTIILNADSPIAQLFN
ncbi:MAG: protease modulator HflC [Oscillospiraceae bacterium]|nr:protease modulator HflC [bacterium]MDY5100087.1 protease modulator HflC [Oscillospiraceae bacterium]